MEVVVLGVASPWQDSKGHPWELVAGVTVCCFPESKEHPEAEGGEVGLGSQQEGASKEWNVVTQGEFKRVGVGSANADTLSKLMVLLVEELVHWEPLVSDVEGAVSPVEHKVVHHNDDEHLLGKCQRSWKSLLSDVQEWVLLVVVPQRQDVASDSNHGMVEDDVEHGGLELLQPGFAVLLPWPLDVLLDLVLLQEWVLHLVDDQPEGIDEQLDISGVT